MGGIAPRGAGLEAAGDGATSTSGRSRKMRRARRGKQAPATAPDETCHRFGFAITQGRAKGEQTTRRRATINHLFSYLDVFDVVDEWEDDSIAWVVVEPANAIPATLARLIAEETPRYSRGSFQVDHSL